VATLTPMLNLLYLILMICILLLQFVFKLFLVVEFRLLSYVLITFHSCQLFLINSTNVRIYSDCTFVMVAAFYTSVFLYFLLAFSLSRSVRIIYRFVFFINSYNTALFLRKWYSHNLIHINKTHCDLKSFFLPIRFRKCLI